QKQKERNGGKENNSTLWRLLIGLGALVLVLIPLVYPSLIQFFWPSPDFGVKNAVRKADLPITIIAKNSTAKRKEPLDVRWDNIPFDRGAIPHSDPNIFQWTFSVKDKHLPKKYKKDAEHKLEVGFDGKFSKPITIVFFSQAPIVEAKLQTADDNPRNKILIGKAASKLQDPKEFIRVDVIFFTLGSEFSLPLPVKRITDSEGKIYFQFRTPIEGIPEIPPENPLYDSPFFAFLVTDQAGNRYYHSMSYAQFAAP
ncbi:MAG: hypothetical protein GTN82_26335, partial [Candidatus Aminicenantes bacterium]|nr:hypothetical protein [Candidatus Aminicenantes bacterium]